MENLPPVLNVETELTCTECRIPAFCACYRLNALSIAETVDLACEEVIRVLIHICSVEILTEEVAEFIQLIVCADCNLVILKSPREVVCEGIDVLIKAVSHRRALVSNAQSATADI